MRLNLTSSELLNIKVPELLYTNNAVEAKKEFRKLSSKWHPDHGGDNHVFAHIKELYESAVEKISKGHWMIPGVLDITTLDGKRYQIKYRKHHVFELGDMYISDTVVAYFIKKENKDLVESSRRILSGLKYSSDRMKKEFSKYLPNVVLDAETKDYMVVVYKKTPDLILLRDLIEHQGGSISTKHVAWILSSIYNTACFLSFNSLSHNAIDVNTYFVSPKHHSGALLGGWWYSSRFGDRVKALPKITMVHAGLYLSDKKSIDAKIDLQMVKTMGLSMLGDPNGTKIMMKMKKDPKKMPSPFVSWLKGPPGNRAVDDYKTYKDNVLTASWGPPTFFDLKVTANDVYND